MTDTQWPRYEVFKQDKPGKPHEAVGSVHAPDAEMAMLNARNVFVRRPSAVSLWVVAADVIRTVALEATLQSVLVLGLLVLIRTFLSWALVVEMEGNWPWRVGRGGGGSEA